MSHILSYKLWTDTSTIGLFSYKSLSTNLYGKDYDEWLQNYDNNPYVELSTTVTKYTDKGYVIDTTADGFYKIRILKDFDKIIIPLFVSKSKKYKMKYVGELHTNGYILLSSIENMFEMKKKLTPEYIRKIMKDKKIHKFRKGRGLIMKLSKSYCYIVNSKDGFVSVWLSKEKIK